MTSATPQYAVSSSETPLQKCGVIVRELRPEYAQQHKQAELSKPETPVRRSTFNAVGEVLAYIPRERYSDINEGIAHANRMTLLGRLTVMNVIYLKG